MMRFLSILAIVILYPIAGICGSYKQQWKKATDYYLQKEYDSAAFYFEQIAASKPQNAEVYYNLGNAYYRLNKIAPAVLNYQRALHINPSYKEAQDNLIITKARISHHIAPIEDIFFIAWWKSITSHTLATTWAVLSLIVFLLIIASVWLRKFHGSGTRIPVQVPGILGFVCFCFLLFAFVSAGKSYGTSGAVVMENDAPLMNNLQKGKPLSLIPEGTTVKIISENEMWVEVSLPDGRVGWLQQSHITKI